MKMEIVVAEPPMFYEIDKVFDVAGKSVIFAWGDKIYNPTGAVVTKELQAHEAIHGVRQLDMGVEDWWGQYLVDTEFRLVEELPAHRAEYQAYCRRHHAPNDRHRALGIVAPKLAAPLYGSLISVADARDAILTGRLP